MFSFGFKNKRFNSALVASIFAATQLLAALAPFALAPAASAQNNNENKVRICHAASAFTNPYQSIEVDHSAVDGQGNNDHSQHTGLVFNPAIHSQQNNTWGDIIPPVPGVIPAGLNWSTEGQAIWNNNCNPRGSITIVKDAKPNDSQDFQFTATGSDVSNFALDDDSNGTLSNTKQFTNLLTGSYSFTEQAVSGWDLKDIVCSQGASIQVNGATVAISLATAQSVTCTYTNLKRGTITVHKVTDPANDPTAFSITASGTGTISGNAARSLTTSQDVVYSVGQGTYSVSEDDIANWSEIGNTCTNLVINATNLSATCTITNQNVTPKLTVTKVVTNNNGGTLDIANFPLFVGNTSVTSGVQSSFNAGNYTVSETNQPGYSGIISGDCATDGSITLAEGDVKACIITNDDIAPSLTLVKTVTNNNGGNKQVADFPLFIDNTLVLSGVLTFLNAGSHTASETPDSGYLASIWGGDCNSDGTIILVLAQTATCTITNDDKPGNLIVKKVVINDNGGDKNADDFSFAVNGSSLETFEADGQNDYEVNAGTYSVVESAAPGYTTTYDNCSNLSIPNGGTATCTITNDDIQPKLTITKVVTNNNGGEATVEDFPLWVDQTGVTSGEENGFSAGDYTVSETNQDGYTGTISGDCASDGSITLALGDDKSCTITNNDNAPKVTIVKNTNPEAVSGVDFDFNIENGEFNQGFTLDTDSDTSTDNEKEFSSELNAGTVTISETLPDGWSENIFISCEGAEYNVDGLSVTFDLGLGDEVTCVFTNAQKSKVVVTKYDDVNRNGEFDPDENTLGVADTPLPGWNMTLDGESQTTGANGTAAFNSVEPYEYHVLSEIQKNGWFLSDISCDNEEREGQLLDRVLDQNLQTLTDNQEGYSFYILPGETVNCLIGNYRDVELNLTKSNDRPNPTNVGDTVTYTLTLTAPETSGVVYNVETQDLPPENFKYVPGSWTATSNVRGNLKNAGITTEPTYGSPGAWIVGTMIPGEIVKLTYRAIIGAPVTPGTYPDLAFATGCASSGSSCADEEIVLSNTKRANDPFVTTAVSILAPKVTLANTGTSISVVYAVIASVLLLGGYFVARRQDATKGGL